MFYLWAKCRLINGDPFIKPKGKETLLFLLKSSQLTEYTAPDNLREIGDGLFEEKMHLVDVIPCKKLIFRIAYYQSVQTLFGDVISKDGLVTEEVYDAYDESEDD